MTPSHAMLLCAVGDRVCGLPLDQVSETLRPLRIDPLPGAPGFVTGVSLIRGRPTPVVDAARLLGETQAPVPRRVVTLKVGARVLGLAVTQVLGVRRVGPTVLEALPKLLDQTLAEKLGTLDDELLVVLRTARAVPDSVWAQLEAAR